MGRLGNLILEMILLEIRKEWLWLSENKGSEVEMVLDHVIFPVWRYERLGSIDSMEVEVKRIKFREM